ncbi:MAG: alpha/beta hydrolase [Anaerolineales bacterium]|nr:alpha/beta hydrolase [Anaerolineales bacterium]
MSAYDTYLARYPVPVDSHYVESRFGRTHILSSGNADAPPLVLIHGMGVNALMWARHMPELSAHFRVHAIDIPGQPGKSHAVRPDRRGSAIADWLCEVISALSDSPIYLGAISLGGWFALSYASHYPERVSKLALLAPAGVVRARYWHMIKHYVPVLLEGSPAYKRMIQRMAYTALDAEAQEYLLACYQAYRSHLTVLPKRLRDGQMRRITAEVLALVGTTDFFFDPGRTQRRLKCLLPAAHLKQLPNCDHYIPLDQGERMMASLLTFFLGTKP